MRTVIALIIALVTLLAVPLQASAQVMSVESWTEEWDPASQTWVRLAPGAERLVAAKPKPQPRHIASYGPFHVANGERARMIGTTDGASPRHFAAMLRDFPELEVLEMVECPGTDDDRANMKLGRMIRSAGIATHVPADGSVRSGAVELFLAGAERKIDEGAEFAVHAWLDEYGRQPHHFAADSPENRMYLDYYAEMGMDRGQARAFYDMTNSVSHDGAKWLTAQDMRRWIGSDAAAEDAKLAAAPAIAYLDLGYAAP